MRNDPIVVRCDREVASSPEALRDLILDVDQWTSFRGYAIIPAIRSARYLVRTPEVVGSRIEVENTDGSRHVEEIVTCTPDHLSMRFHLSPPASALASHFVEHMRFTPLEGGARTRVERSMELHPKTALTRPILWVVSRFLEKALDRHLRQLPSPRAK